MHLLSCLDIANEVNKNVSISVYFIDPGSIEVEQYITSDIKS